MKHLYQDKYIIRFSYLKNETRIIFGILPRRILVRIYICQENNLLPKHNGNPYTDRSTLTFLYVNFGRVTLQYANKIYSCIDIFKVIIKKDYKVYWRDYYLLADKIYLSPQNVNISLGSPWGAKGSFQRKELIYSKPHFSIKEWIEHFFMGLKFFFTPDFDSEVFITCLRIEAQRLMFYSRHCYSKLNFPVTKRGLKYMCTVEF